MQLLIVLMLALMGGNTNAIKEVKPILESLGGGEALEALSKAEELSGMISAVQAMAAAQKGATRANSPHGGGSGDCAENSNGEFAQHGFPLAPVALIADENITYCLSRYITLGE